MNLQKITDAYIEAVYFTEQTPDTPENEGLDLTTAFLAEAVEDCRAFVLAVQAAGIDPQADPDQIGHDFWFTRNGHGVGFWDRPEIYGQSDADALTDIARGFGEAYADFI
jgi:hypothetical protein